MSNTTPTIFYICNDPERALGPEAFIDNYHIVCIDNSPLLPLLKAKGIKYFSLGETLGDSNTIFRNSNKLLARKEVQEYIAANCGDQAYVQFFKIAPNIERESAKLGYTVLNSSSVLNRKFENKLSQYESLSGSVKNFPPTVITKLLDASYQDLSDELGEEMVVQFDRGHTGSGTLFIKSESQFNEVKDEFPNRVARIAKMIEGEAWTLNACVTRFGIAYGGLCKQITGIPELTSEAGGTVGNDWTQVSGLSQEMLQQIGELTERVGELMAADGYKGLFGLDLIITPNNELYLIEINARQPASTGMHSKLMLQSEQIPLIAFHIAEFAFKGDEQYLAFINQTFNKQFNEDKISHFIKSQNHTSLSSLNASQIIIRNKSGKDLKIKDAIPAGEYNSSLEKAGENYSISEIDRANFILLHTAQGQEVSPGSEIARIQAPESVLDGDNLKLQYAKMVELINQNNDNMSSEHRSEQQTAPSITSQAENIVTKELPTEVQQYIRKYFELPINGVLVTTPYFRNVKRVRAELRVLVGKGTPEELVEETLIYAKLRGFELRGKTAEEIREFMMEQGLGVDCSAFVAHTYNYYMRVTESGSLWAKAKYPNKGFYRNFIRMLRPVENLGAEILTNLENCDKIELAQIEPGDLIRMKGLKGGDHLALVYAVQYDQSDRPTKFTYVHSISRYGKANGVRFGDVIINDANGELKDQEWLEKDEDGICWTLKELKTEYEDNGLRRPKFKPNAR
ncbi:MAG: ATP-grasp domain-containing protein [Candidatus Dojkabacteria bacterium]|nr:MAG: ATP-grasp domain-containing protein [Candidatus Dojkabacteria bacterium]